MKSTAIVCAIAAGALGFSSLSFAQGYTTQPPPVVPEYRHGQRDAQRQQEQYRHRDQSRSYDQNRSYDQHRSYDRHTEYRDYNYSHQNQWAARAHRFQRGDQVPYQFRQRQYYVNDWRAHQLYAPPYGHQWVRSDTGDYILMALATGLIVNLMLNQ